MTIWQKTTRLLLVLIVASISTRTARADDPEVFRINANDTPEDCIADRTTPACALAKELQSTVITAQFGPESTPIIARLLDFLLSVDRDRARKEVVVPAAIDYRIAFFHIYGPDAQTEFLELHPGWESVPSDLRPISRIKPGIAELWVDIRYYDASGLAWPPSDWPEPDNWQREIYRFEPEGNGWRNSGSGVTRPYRQITERSDFSPCIGDPRTPLCAVETYIACRVRNDVSLCEAADHTYPESFEAWDGSEEFQVESMVWVSNNDRQTRPTVVIRLRGPAVWSSGSGFSPGQLTRYSVMNFGDHWQVVEREVIVED